jgi:hypothetical protein
MQRAGEREISARRRDLCIGPELRHDARVFKRQCRKQINGRKVNVVHDSSYDCSGIGQVYKFLRRAFDDSTAELEFQNFLQGNLSEKILERAREWIEQDRRLRACEEAANLRQTF